MFLLAFSSDFIISRLQVHLQSEKHELEVLDVPGDVEIEVKLPVFVEETFVENAHLVGWHAVFPRNLELLNKLVLFGGESLIVIPPEFVNPDVNFLPT